MAVRQLITNLAECDLCGAQFQQAGYTAPEFDLNLWHLHSTFRGPWGKGLGGTVQFDVCTGCMTKTIGELRTAMQDAARQEEKPPWGL